MSDYANVKAKHGKYVHRAIDRGDRPDRPFWSPFGILCHRAPDWHFRRANVTTDPVDCPHCLAYMPG